MDQSIQDAVRFDIESRTYYWNGDVWVPKAEFSKVGDPRLVTGTFKGSLPNIQSLPVSGNVIGDFYVVDASSLTIAMTDGKIMEGFGAAPVAEAALMCHETGIGVANSANAATTLSGGLLKGKLSFGTGLATELLGEINDGRTANSLEQKVLEHFQHGIKEGTVVLTKCTGLDADDVTYYMSAIHADSSLAGTIAIEVNKLCVTATPCASVMALRVTYDGRPVIVDSSAY